MMNMKYAAILLMATPIVCSFPSVSAQEDAGSGFSYSYIEGGYLRRTDGLNTQLVDNGLPSDISAQAGNGFFVRASLELQKGVYVFGVYEREESDYDISAAIGTDALNGDFGVKYQAGRFGLGYYSSINDNMDIYYQAGVSYGEFKAGAGTVTQVSDGTRLPIDLSDESQSGISGNVEVGFRTRLNPRFELDGSVFLNGAQRLKNADADSLKVASDIGAKAAVRFNVSSVFSLGAEYQRSQMNRFLVTARARF